MHELPAVELRREVAVLEVAESDYINAGRRSPEMPGPDGSLGPLDPATKVIAFLPLTLPLPLPLPLTLLTLAQTASLTLTLPR